MFSLIQFYKLLWLWFYVDFFLNLEFCYSAVEYRHKYLNRQHISIRKTSLLYSIYEGITRRDPSATSELRVSVQPAKLASPTRLLCEKLPNVYVFSAHKMFTTFCVPFPNRISHFKVMAMP